MQAAGGSAAAVDQVDAVDEVDEVDSVESVDQVDQVDSVDLLLADSGLPVEPYPPKVPLPLAFIIHHSSFIIHHSSFIVPLSHLHEIPQQLRPVFREERLGMELHALHQMLRVAHAHQLALVAVSGG